MRINNSLPSYEASLIKHTKNTAAFGSSIDNLAIIPTSVRKNNRDHNEVPVKKVFEEVLSPENARDLPVDGTSERTEEKRDYLKSNYDIQNMRDGQYRHLMSDLLQMGLISQEYYDRYDKGVFVNDPATFFSGNTGLYEYRDGDDVTLVCGNVLQNMKGVLAGLSGAQSAIASGQIPMNGAQYLEAQDNIRNSEGYYGHLVDLFEWMKRD